MYKNLYMDRKKKSRFKVVRTPKYLHSSKQFACSPPTQFASPSESSDSPKTVLRVLNDFCFLLVFVSTLKVEQEKVCISHILYKYATYS